MTGDSDTKTETLNLRVSPYLKSALQVAAKRECRSMSNMVEFLVLTYCREHGLIHEELLIPQQNKKP